DERAAPAHVAVAVRPDAVRDPDHDQHQAEGERDVPPPVDRCALRLARLAEAPVRPERADQAERDGDEEDQPPVDRSQDAAEDEAEELAAYPDDVRDPERKPA